jgi:hypothetical protein
MKEPQQGLERRLGSDVRQRCGLSQPTNPPASSSKGAAELGQTDISAPHGRVEDDHHVEKPEVASQRQQNIRRGHDGQPPHPLDGRHRGRPDHSELGPARAVPVVLSGELRQAGG